MEAGSLLGEALRDRQRAASPLDGLCGERETSFSFGRVSYYLPEESVRAVLAAIRDHAAAGSGLVFEQLRTRRGAG